MAQSGFGLDPSVPRPTHAVGRADHQRPSSRRTRSQSASRCPSWSVGTRTWATRRALYGGEALVAELRRRGQ